MTNTLQKSADELLVNYARAIREWQERRPLKLSDEALIRRYPALGSTKTYKRILVGDTAELRAAEWAEKYRGVLTQIDTEEAETSKAEALYDDLEPARAVRTAVASVVRSMGIERLVIVQGDTGSGKTSSLKLIAGLYPGNVTTVEANVGWRSFASAMGDIAIALGLADDAAKLPVSGSARLDAIVRHIGESRRLVLIDEGHHMTADVLNAVKTMINRTGARFVVAAQSTLWRKLQAASLQEAKQLLLNRLRERVYLAGPSADDVALYLGRRCELDVSTATALEISKAAAKGGAYAFLRRLAASLCDSRKDICEATALEVTRSLSATLA